MLADSPGTESRVHGAARSIGVCQLVVESSGHGDHPHAGRSLLQSPGQHHHPAGVDVEPRRHLGRRRQRDRGAGVRSRVDGRARRADRPPHHRAGADRRPRHHQGDAADLDPRHAPAGRPRLPRGADDQRQAPRIAPHHRGSPGGDPARRDGVAARGLRAPARASVRLRAAARQPRPGGGRARPLLLPRARAAAGRAVRRRPPSCVHEPPRHRHGARDARASGSSS